MSQVDKLNYIPLLVWFIILMVLLYIVVFVHFLPLAYSIVSVRSKFINILINESYGLTQMLLQIINFASTISVPAINSAQLLITVSLPALLYNYILIK